MEHNHHNQQRYTCPMHPEIVKNEPGSCPKCGMNLIVVNARAGEEHSHQHKQQETEKHSEHEQHTAPIVNITKANGFQKFTCPMQNLVQMKDIKLIHQVSQISKNDFM